MVFLVTLILFISGCSEDNNESSFDLRGNWKVAYFSVNGTRITKADKNTWPDINNGDITANFSSPDVNGKGTVSGFTVSNAYNGEYALEGNGKIMIGPISTTFINEPEWTELYNISAAQTFELRNSELIIYYNEGKSIIAFERN